MKLEESSLFQSLNSANRFSARDVADLAFLYMVTLHILRLDFHSAPFARKYARATMGNGLWDHVRLSSTDLYQLLNICAEKQKAWIDKLKSPSASQTLMEDIYLDTTAVKRFLQNIIQGGFDPHKSGQLLTRFQQSLRIQVTNYKSIRRIAQDWMEPHVDTEAKSLVVTRLLQAMRFRALRGDLIHELELLSRREKLELQDVCNPETGKNCEDNNTGLVRVPLATAKPTVSKEPKEPSLMKKLAMSAGIGVGAALLAPVLFGRHRK
jgi:hypothetical protein